MRQLDLFEQDLYTPTLSAMPLTEGFLTPATPFDVEHLRLGQIDNGLRISNPPIPGYYIAMTCINPRDFNGTPRQMGYTKFWNGFGWFYPEGVGVDSAQHKVLWDPAIPVSQPIVDLSKLEPTGVDSSCRIPGWRRDIPNFPGVFFATDSENRTFNYIRSFNGTKWSRASMASYAKSGHDMAWNSNRIPTKEEIINYLKKG